MGILLEDAERLRMCAFKPRGWERNALERRCEVGEIVRPMPGMYARTKYWDGLTRVQKLLHVVKTEGVMHAGWVFSHATAAFVHGLDLSWDLLWPIHYTTSRGGGGKSQRLYVHHRSGDLKSVVIDDVKVTTVCRTVVDCARTLSFGHALAVADSALHKGMTTKADLEAYAAGHVGLRGMRAARCVLGLADPRPESGGESRVRALMMELGLPEPELQAPIPNPERPAQVFRVDFLFRPPGMPPVAFELDGMEKYLDPQMTGGRSTVRVMARERQREALITASGVRVMRLGFEQAMSPAVLLDRFAAYGIVPERVG